MSPLLRRWVVFAVLALCTLIALNHIASLPSRPGKKINPPSTNDEQQIQIPPPRPQNPAAEVSLEEPKDDKFHWETIPPRFPVKSMIPYPSGPAVQIPRIQHDFTKNTETEEHRRERKSRLAAVKEAFEHSWGGYRTHAWLHDEVRPISGEANDPFGGWGATLVDSLDTLWIMGMEDEFATAVAALDEIDFGKCAMKDVNLFETTIRYLGGFLAAYDMSDGKYPILKKKAVEVAELMYRAFDTPNRMPITRWDWQAYLDGEVQVTPTLEIVAELGSLTLEFTRLSQITGDPKWFDAVQRISDRFELEQNRTVIPGLWPLTVNPASTNAWTDSTFTIGGMADSVFEYLPKQYLLLGGRRPEYGRMHMDVVRATKEYLLFEPLIPPATSSQQQLNPKPPLILGTTRVNNNPKLDPRGEHLTCFAGGMIALGARALSDQRPAADTTEDLEVARRLTEGCIWSYSATATGIGPEIFSVEPCRKGRDAVTGGREPDYEGVRGDCTWDRTRWLRAVKQGWRGGGREDGGASEDYVTEHGLGGGFTEILDAKYILRPEAAESVFLLYRITGDDSLQDAAWRMFSAIVKHTRTEIAFAAMPDVRDDHGGSGRGTGGGEAWDSMESFWTAETLKYFYLVFAEPGVVDLDAWVLNTEAHPLRWR